MRLPSIDFPVTSEWPRLNGRRLDGRPYVSGAVEARVLLEKLKVEKVPLHLVTANIFHAGREGRRYVDDPEYGVPFLGSTDILNADLTALPLLSKKQVASNPLFTLGKDWTLITRSGTVGRIAYVRPDMVGMACSEHVMRVVPNLDEILPGYLYAYLSSRFGVPLVIEGTYGAVIQHIEPLHIVNLPVPWLGKKIEESAHERINQAAKLRSEYQLQLRKATNLLFSSVGLRDITPAEWHAMGADLGFAKTLNTPLSLRSLNFNPRLEACLEKLRGVPHMTLGEICRGGKLQRGERFKRVECEKEYGIKLVGQKELFWLEPEGRWIAPKHAPQGIFVEDETTMIAAQGTLGENEVFCRAEFISGPWLKFAYTEHLLRVQSNHQTVSGAFLFAFLRSEMIFRCLRSISTGSKQQDLRRKFLANLPVPLPAESVRTEVEGLVRDAYRKRHKASELEREAIIKVEEAIQEGAKDGKHSGGGAAAQ